MMRHARKLGYDGGGADLEGVKAAEYVAANDFLGFAVPFEVAVMIHDILIARWLAVRCDDEVSPPEAEEVEERLGDGVVCAVAAEVGAFAGGFVRGALDFEMVAEEVEDGADGGG